MKLVVATQNPSKMIQIRALLEGLPVTLLSMNDAGVEGAAEEDGETLAENATKKALFVRDRSGVASFADDTGLFIDALDGKPGIHAARWAGDDKTTEEIMEHTLRALQGVPSEKRTATFRTVVVLALPDGTTHEFHGEAPGKLLFEPRVPPQQKMPYSGIFLPDESDKVWAQMSVAEENAISHRGKAFRLMRKFIEGR